MSKIEPNNYVVYFLKMIFGEDIGFFNQKRAETRSIIN